jgi:hypothetical protein
VPAIISPSKTVEKTVPAPTQQAVTSASKLETLLCPVCQQLQIGITLVDMDKHIDECLSSGLLEEERQKTVVPQPSPMTIPIPPKIQTKAMPTVTYKERIPDDYDEDEDDYRYEKGNYKYYSRYCIGDQRSNLLLTFSCIFLTFRCT